MMRGANFITYFLAGAVPRLGMFVILFVLAQRISIAETGLFALVVTVGEMVEMTSANWLRVFVQAREAGQDRIRSLRAGRILVLALAMLVLALLTVVPIASIVAPSRMGQFAIAVCAYIAAFALLRLVLAVQQITHQHRLFARIELARGVTVLVTVIAATFLPGASFFEPALALAGTTLIAAIWGAVAGRERVSRPAFSGHGFGTAFRFGLPVIADTGFNFLIVYFDRLVLNEFLGPAGVGLYAMAFALGRQPVDFVTGPMNNLVVPVLFTARAREGDARAREMQTGFAVTLTVLCAAVLVGVLLLREPIAALLVKAELRDEICNILPILTAAACVLVFKVFLYDNLFFMTGRNALKLKAVAPAALIGAMISFLMVRSHGLFGAAMAALIASCLALACSVVATRSFFLFPLRYGVMAFVVGAAMIAGLALAGAAALAAPLGPLAQIMAGFIAFCLVYGVALKLGGVSLKRLVTSPWAPLRDDRV
ncbi:MAG TPA: oligosaccharide flippase family protein [Beijerinckiaceae bacterium]|nr:oligosaccharide flippase family protein [Beijerinckiaceae bacterium]